ncbi:MAG: hypothetical protein E6Q97_20220 [Desulfurellales bacterium]|nr:MAG: hypothetical protein E6Q97_20220 [Desulfurellales bacterium]
MASEGARGRQTRPAVTGRLDRVMAAIGRAAGRATATGRAGAARLAQLAARARGATGAAERILSRGTREPLLAGQAPAATRRGARAPRG